MRVFDSVSELLPNKRKLLFTRPPTPALRLGNPVLSAPRQATTEGYDRLNAMLWRGKPTDYKYSAEKRQIQTRLNRLWKNRVVA